MLDFKRFRGVIQKSQEECAREIGVSQSTISRLEDGCNPGLDTWEQVRRWADAIADQLELPPEKRLSAKAQVRRIASQSATA